MPAILSAPHENRIRNLGMSAVFKIAADEGIDPSDVLHILFAAPPFPSQPGASSSHAPAADTPVVPASVPDGEAQFSSLASPSANFITESAAPASTPAKPTDDAAKHAEEAPTGAGGVQGRCEPTPPPPSPKSPAIAPEPDSRSPGSRQTGSGDFLPGEADQSHRAETPEGQGQPSPCDDDGDADKPAGASAPAAPPTKITNRQRVRECHEAHPDWTAAQIAEATGLGRHQVYVIANQIKLKLGKDVAAKPEKAEPAAEAPTARGAQKALPVKRAEPAKPVAATVPNVPMRPVPTHAPVGASPGQRFYVRDERDRYLHQSLERSPTDTGPLMTNNRKWAWYGTKQQLAGAMNKWPEIGEMRVERPQP